MKLPSGAELEVKLAPFEDSRALWSALLEEARSIKADPNTEIDVNLFKDMFCTAFSSKKIEACLWKCMQRCLYKDQRGDLKVDKDTFEPEEARQDYMTACFEVAKANCSPFLKTLAQSYSQILEVLKKGQA